MSLSKVSIPAGKYVIAVSGGVDSVALLHLVSQMPNIEAVVAHFDHGIRDDSASDAGFVSMLSGHYGMKFMTERAELGPGATENAARSARYEFLRRVMKSSGAKAILTAHHQDDLLETIVMHIQRGTGRRGLDPMRAHPDIMRPLINIPKQDILIYAVENGLQWREDSTNADTKYRRNHVRHKIMPKLANNRDELVNLNDSSRLNNDEIDSHLQELDSYLLGPKNELDRSRFLTLPHVVATEYMHRWLAKNDVKNLDFVVVTRATIAAKTLAAGKKIDLKSGHWLVSEATSLQILSK